MFFSFVWRRNAPAAKKTGPLLLLFSSLLAVVSPWMVRNYVLHGRIVILPTKGNYVLLMGNNPRADGKGRRVPQEYMDAVRGLPELDQARKAREFALDWIKDNPRRFVALGMKKLYYLWTPLPNYEQNIGVTLMKTVSYGFSLLGTWCAIFLFRKRWKLLSLFYLLIIMQSMVAFVYTGSGRYRFPLEGVLVLMASASVTCLVAKVEKWRKQNSR